MYVISYYKIVLIFYSGICLESWIDDPYMI